MIVTLVVPDEIYSVYAERDPKDPNSQLVRQLIRFVDFPVSERPVILPPKVRAELEALFGTTIDEPQRFVDWIRRMISINVDGLEYTLSGEQRRALEGEARFYPSKDVVDILREKLRYGLCAAFGGQP